MIFTIILGVIVVLLGLGLFYQAMSLEKLSSEKEIALRSLGQAQKENRNLFSSLSDSNNELRAKIEHMAVCLDLVIKELPDGSGFKGNNYILTVIEHNKKAFEDELKEVNRIAGRRV